MTIMRCFSPPPENRDGEHSIEVSLSFLSFSRTMSNFAPSHSNFCSARELSGKTGARPSPRFSCFPPPVRTECDDERRSVDACGWLLLQYFFVAPMQSLVPPKLSVRHDAGVAGDEDDEGMESKRPAAPHNPLDPLNPLFGAVGVLRSPPQSSPGLKNRNSPRMDVWIALPPFQSRLGLLLLLAPSLLLLAPA